MGQKLLWLGLTMITALPALGVNRVFQLVGSILMVVGAVLLLLDK